MNGNGFRILIGPDCRISSTAPAELPPGDHEATINVAVSPLAKRLRLADLAVHDTPWDGSVSLRRVDMYGDDGR